MKSYWNNEQAQNWTGAIVLAVVGALAMFVEYGNYGAWNSRLTWVFALSLANLLAFCVFLTDWADAPGRRIAVLVVQACLIVPLYFLVEISFIAILGIVWIVQIAEYCSIRTTTWWLLISAAIFTGSQFYHFHDSSITFAIVGSVTLGMFQLFAVITTHRANREQELREHTAALNRELIATRELLSQSARQSERLRIARDLHDLLGHHLTALILNLEVATHSSEGKALQKVEQSLALGKLLLSDLRTAVNELRDDDTIDLRQSVNKLIADIPHLQISVDFSTAPAIHDVDVAETLLRCIQEALTNVLRHSKATQCRIALLEAYNDFFLTVKDNGVGNTVVVPGNGLKGMSERVRAAGGEVSWQQENDGFLLQLRLPAGGRP